MKRRIVAAAFTILELVVVIAIVAILIALTVPAVQKARDAATRSSCLNNMRQIGYAVQQYHQIYNTLPPGVTHPFLVSLYGPALDQYPLLNWTGRLLPFIEQEAVWAETQQAYAQDFYSLDNPPHVGINTPISVYICPADGRRAKPGLSLDQSPATTSYLGVAGTNTARADGLFFVDSRVRLTDIKDGTSNTLMVGERPPSLDLRYGRWYGGWGVWDSANAFLGVRESGIFDPQYPLCPEGPYTYQIGSLSDPCSTFHYWSMHSGGANFLFADGSVRFLPYSAAPILPALATRAGGEVIDWNY